jgi:3-oxoacyl-[acyl-carrier protein] reductase
MRVAIITGAAGNGIGRSAALALSRDGFAVVVNYRTSRDSAETVVNTITSNGGRAISVQADVFAKSDCDKLIKETILAYHRVDALILGPGADWNAEPLEQLKDRESLQDVTNELKPVYYLLPSVIQEMKKGKSGRIIGIASNTQIPSPSYAYNVAKGARTQALLEAVNYCWNLGITVNAIAPGPVDHHQDIHEALNIMQRGVELSKKITPQEVAEGISFLCSEKGRYITGNVLNYRF